MTNDANSLVVGLGASAGGLQAFKTFFAYEGLPVGYNWCEFGIIMIALGAAIAAFFVLELPLAAYAALSLMFPLCSGLLSSMQRYTATAVPLYLVLAMLMERAYPRLVLRSIWMAACVYTTALFSLSYWAG